MQRPSHILCFIFVMLLNGFLFSQLNLHFSLNVVVEQCTKGNASLIINGIMDKDSVVINWSTGENGVTHIPNLNSGHYHVRVFVKRVKDSKVFTKDTLIVFTIEKRECLISVSKFFSPNDDQYNDVLLIKNISYYPNFELDIFNKWGQRVHTQKKEYEPWNGKWLGVDLPDGSYYYVLFYDASDKQKLEKGNITILR